MSTIYPSAATSAKDLIDSFLSDIGLQSLGDWAWNLYLDGASADEVMVQVRKTPEYKTRFPAMEELAKQGRAISEAAYIDYERTVQGYLHQFGIPRGMYDTPEGIAGLLVRGVKVDEVAQRLQTAAAAAYNAPQEVKDTFRDYYMGTGGDLTAYFLDPDRAQPLIDQQVAAARIGAAAKMQQLGLGRTEAERLAANGVTFEQALQGFGDVASTQALGGGFGETADQGTRVAAAFGDSQAQRTVQRVQRARLAQSAQGGGMAESSQGVAGLARSTS